MVVDSKIIDLTGNKKGVTIYFKFKDVFAPFLVVITDVSGQVVFYKRDYNKSNLSANLPVHPDNVLVLVTGGPKIESTIVSPLKKLKIPYYFNFDIMVERPYPVTAIQSRVIPSIMEKGPGGIMIESKTPARFLPSLGMIEYNERIAKTLPQPVNEFVKLHEIGHYYYGRPVPNPVPLQELKFYNDQLKQDEMEADRFALYQFINSGYNFSGALYSLTDHLSDNYISKERMKGLFDEIKKMHKQINVE